MFVQGFRLPREEIITCAGDLRTIAVPEILRRHGHAVDQRGIHPIRRILKSKMTADRRLTEAFSPHGHHGYRTLGIDFQHVDALLAHLRFPSVPELRSLIMSRPRHQRPGRATCQAVAESVGDWSVRINTVPIALERLPYADMLDAKPLFQHVDCMPQPLRETLGIGIEGTQFLLRPVDIRPTVIDQHPGDVHSQIMEFLHLLDDLALIDILPQRIPSAPAQAGQVVRKRFPPASADARTPGCRRYTRLDGTVRSFRRCHEPQRRFDAGHSHTVRRDHECDALLVSSDVSTGIGITHRQHRAPSHTIVTAFPPPEQQLGAERNLRGRRTPCRSHPPLLVLVQRQNLAVSNAHPATDPHRIAGRE